MSGSSYEAYSPDASGGCRLQDWHERELRLGHPRLKALDLVRAPELTTLRITQKAEHAPLHLMLQATPALTRIELPECDSGAVLHLADAKRPADLHIEGAVAQVDADWQTTRFLMERDGGTRPWQRVRVVAPTDVEGLSPGAGLVIVIGHEGDETEKLRLEEGDDWLVLGGDQLQHIQINTAGRVRIQNAPALTAITGNAEQTVLDVSDARRLEYVSGVGQHITLRQQGPSTRRLTIAGAWAEATLRCPQLEELHFPQAKALTLYYCERLKVVELPLGVPTECHGSVPDSLLASSRLFMDESTLSRHLEAVHAGDHSQVNVLLRVLAHRHKRGEVVSALRALRSLCEAGVDPAEVWSVRQELLARQLKRSKRKKSLGLTKGEYARATKRWDWTLPDDLAQEGLQADLAIWRSCRVHCDEARDYSSVLGNQCRSLPCLSALVTNGIRAEAEPIDHQIMTRALQGMAEAPLSRELSQSAEGRALARRLEWLVQTDRIDDRTHKAILDLMTAGLTVSKLAELFERLLARQPKEIRMRAIRLAYASDQWIQETFGIVANPRRVRSRFLQMALTPEPASPIQEAQ
ncbi:hypothetical protein DES49_0673 [Halospina denitrificans]|uniref:Uncharacterized protein n=1 Tax=Halospina denitrificans TaxID=332522 RepID=A0A4R7K148_9GAMM|nr:hypothetical protein [Halospina denitrificans]TDT44562.1 hypothetical protein DES49_0673 [Halospina denitrificans]